MVPSLLGAVVLIFPLGFIVPHWLGKMAFGWPQRIAVTFSSGMKNLPIAVWPCSRQLSQAAACGPARSSCFHLADAHCERLLPLSALAGAVIAVVIGSEMRPGSGKEVRCVQEDPVGN
jgi:hypothetical protein